MSEGDAFFVQPAEWELVIFGDGLSAEITEQYPTRVNENGDKIVGMRIRMEELLLARAGISYDDLDVDDSFYVEYPEAWIVTLSEDPVNRVKLVKCTLWGEETRLTDDTDAYDSTIRALEHRLNKLKEENAYLHSEMDRLQTNIHEHDMRMVERFKVPMALRKHLPKDEKDKETYLGGEE